VQTAVTETYICAAIGTPLTGDETLHSEGLHAHLEAQRDARMNGVLVAGTMGAMQLLMGRTYEKLVRESVSEWRDGDLLVGVGDLSLARTKERLQFVNELKVDGAVVLSPFFLKYSQSELIEYFEAVAAASRAPVYLYDLPQRTGVSLDVETVVRLAEHPNIAGIKCSGDLGQVRRLSDALQGSSFRVIAAQSTIIDVLLKAGFSQHVDGIYCIAPQLVRDIAAAGAKLDWNEAAKKTRRLNDLLMKIVEYGVFPAMTAVLNHRGIPGSFAPRPHWPLTPEASERLLAEPAVRAAFNEA